MAWHDGELFPADKDWVNAPQHKDCTHDHVFAPKDKVGQMGAGPQGTMCLWCQDCDDPWWEPLGNIKGSPWEGK